MTTSRYNGGSPEASKDWTDTNVANVRNSLVKVNLSGISEGTLLRLVEVLYIIDHEADPVPAHVSFLALLGCYDSVLTKSRFNHSHIGLEAWLALSRGGHDHGLFLDWMAKKKEMAK